MASHTPVKDIRTSNHLGRRHFLTHPRSHLFPEIHAGPDVELYRLLLWKFYSGINDGKYVTIILTVLFLIKAPDSLARFFVLAELRLVFVRINMRALAPGQSLQDID